MLLSYTRRTQRWAASLVSRMRWQGDSWISFIESVNSTPAGTLLPGARVDGESYGRGRVEEFYGDLVSLESLFNEVLGRRHGGCE